MSSSGAKRRARVRERGKKNPLSNCALDVLLSATKEVLPNAQFRSPILWGSLTKGKFSVWLPKGETLTKPQSKELQAAACLKIAAGGSVNEEGLKAAEMWDDEAAVVKVEEVAALYVIKYQMKFVKPGEATEGEVDDGTTEWIFEITVGQVAADSVAREAEAKKSAGGVNGDKKGEANTKSEKTKKKKEKKSNAPAAKAPKIDAVPAALIELKELLAKHQANSIGALDEAEPLLMMLYNQAYTHGYVAGTKKMDAREADLHNRL